MTIQFKEDSHQYFHNDTELRSVTKWIASHFKSFDPDEERWDGKTWAQATAEYVREEVRGNGPVTKKYPDPFYYSKRLFGDDWLQEVEERSVLKVPINARGVKKYWELKSLLASEEGTRVHKAIESFINGEILFEEYFQDLPVFHAIGVINQFEGEKKSETVVYSVEHGLAGTVDCIIEHEDGTTILDWKTNESLTKKGYSKGILPPTEDLDDSKIGKYTLQLSTYAYLLEMQGHTIHELYIVHVTPDGADKIRVEYMRDKIEEMIEYDRRIHSS